MIINLYRMCQDLNCLPGPGGLLEQDAVLMFWFEVVMLADEERRRIEQRQKGTRPHGT
jgi:hypothetical protein